MSETPDEICGYRVERPLRDSGSFLVIGPGGRRIVLKPLDTDCLLKGALHPSIHERLSRVRELAMAGVANLHGVHREDNAAWLAWEYLPGKTFDELIADPATTSRELQRIARELALTVDSLHLQGIVHGSLVGSNVIMGEDQSLRLTHVSPLLYVDPADDIRSILSVLNHAVQQRGEEDSPLGRLLADIMQAPPPLRALAARLGSLRHENARIAEAHGAADEKAPRVRSLWGAVFFLLLGAALAYMLWLVTRQPA
jgi:serine/threonine protein kinase